MSESTSDPTSTDPAGDAPDTADATENPATEGEICGECWPAGWPESAGADAAHCSHGEWTRWPA